MRFDAVPLTSQPKLTACFPGSALAGPGSLGSSNNTRCLRWQVGGGANQLQQIFRPLDSTVAPILGWDPPQVLMGEGHLSSGQSVISFDHHTLATFPS